MSPETPGWNTWNRRTNSAASSVACGDRVDSPVLHSRSFSSTAGASVGNRVTSAPIGARTRERLAEAVPALELNLTADDLAEIEQAVPAGAARGDRYPPAFMSGLGVGN